MELCIRNKIIDEPIVNILRVAQSELKNGKLRDIVDKRTDVLISCPEHKQGHEQHASCRVLALSDTDIEYGTAHCFTCGYKAPLYKVIGDCFDEDEEFGKDWLIERFGNIFVSKNKYLPEISLKKPDPVYLNPAVLRNYDYYHPYMWKRKLSKEVVDKFRVGYDKDKNAITFPVWDTHNNLCMITARSVSSKFFHIDEEIEKPVYLLNFIINENITSVYVTESQINALTLWTYGYPAIALIGTGSATQYDILKRSGIRNYCLCFDGDEAGDKGRTRFITNMRGDILITSKELPRGKDVNDLSKEEFDNLKLVDY